MRCVRIAIPEIGTPKLNYRAALTLVGAEPVQVSELTDTEGFDGLLLPGGADIDPARYGEPLNGSVGVDPALDELQFGMLDRFVRAGKPVFGICRGHQLIAVYFGLKLIQHLPSAAIHAQEEGSETDQRHRTISVPGTLIDRLYGGESMTNSSHHQAVLADGCGLKTMALSEDGVIEALYHESLPVASVQWHPERMCGAFADAELADGAILLKAFLAECGR